MCEEPRGLTGRRHLTAGEADAAQPPVQEVKHRIRPAVCHQTSLELQVGTGQHGGGHRQGWGCSAERGSVQRLCVHPSSSSPQLGSAPTGARDGHAPTVLGAWCTHPGHCPASARSHEAILRIPNKLFYDSELKACESSELDVRSLYCAWEELPKRVRGAAGRGHGGSPEPQARSPTLSTSRASPSSSMAFAGKT